jgi:tetraacyldisaccharide 4'-kinase
VRKTLENYLQRQWYGGQRPNLLLFLMSGLYKSLTICHRGLYRLGVLHTKKVSCPVIVVGNFTAGGTGKTPFVIALVEALQTRGWKPGIVSRGYGRQSTEPLLVADTSNAKDVGDEPLLIFQQTQCPVQVDANRVAASESLIAKGCNLLIADDGLQHYRLQRDIEIEILDNERRYGNGLMIPAGPLREKPRRCDFQIISGASDSIMLNENQFPMALQLNDAYALNDSSHRRKLASFTEKNITAIAGIGNPERFFTALESHGIMIARQALQDHHMFTHADFNVNNLYLMTEKDAIKCRYLNIANAWVVPLHVNIDSAVFDQIDKKLKAPA